MQKKLSLGLALGCGMARGFAHIGVLKALEQTGISVDFIAGSSMGALIGAAYATGYPVAEMEVQANKFGLKKFAAMAYPSFSRSGILDGKKIEKVLYPFIGDKTFEDCRIPINIVSTDICTGSEVIFSSGPLIPAIRASASSPGLFSPMKYNDMFLVDGGLINPVPANIVKRMGADIIIAVDVTRSVKSYTRFMRNKRGEKKKNDAKTSDKWTPSSSFYDRIKPWQPNIIDILLQTVYIAEEKIAHAQLHDIPIDIVLSPDFGHITMFDFNKSAEIISAGAQSAAAVLDKLKNLLHL